MQDSAVWQFLLNALHAVVWGASLLVALVVFARYLQPRTLVIVTTVAMMGLAMLGAYVRLTDAGLGCPDWPVGKWTVTLLLKPAIVTLHLLGGMALVALLAWLSARQLGVSGGLPATPRAIRPWARFWAWSSWACKSRLVAGSAPIMRRLRALIFRPVMETGRQPWTSGTDSNSSGSWA